MDQYPKYPIGFIQRDMATGELKRYEQIGSYYGWVPHL